MKTHDTSTERKRHNSALVFSRYPVWNSVAILTEVLRGFPQSLHPIAEILPRFDPDRVCLNPSQFVTHQLFYHRRYKELWSYGQRRSTNHTHIQRSRELNKGCRAVKILKFLSNRQKFSKKYSIINCHKNSFSTSRVILGGRTDRHYEANIRFWQFFERT
jgi:hypothetical protein